MYILEKLKELANKSGTLETKTTTLETKVTELESNVTFKLVTQEEFDALSDEEKNSTTVVYAIY